jgi:hypothetical protein
MASAHGSLYQELESLLAEVVPTSKQAHEAVGGGEPGGSGATGSDTSHPSKSVPNLDNPQAAKPGAFAQKLTTELKAQGPGAIDGLPDAKPIKAEEIQGEVGLKQTTIGRDPAQEDDYVGTQDEPGVGTSTDAKFDDGKKYASVQEFMGKTATERDAYATQLANEILADIATAVTPKQADAPPTPAGTPATEPKVAADALTTEAQAGYELARVLGMEKLSAAQRAQLTIADTMRDAIYNAELTSQWLLKSAAFPEEGGEGKKEEPSEDPPADKPSPQPSPAGGGGAPMHEGGAPAPGPGAGAPGAGAPGGDPMMQAIDQLGGAGAPGGAPGGMPGGAPGGMPGGAPGGAPGGDAGGAPVSREELLQGILMAMQELGITPEEVAQAAASGGTPQHQQAQKMASAAKDYQRSGKFEFAPPATKRAREIVNRAKSMLIELF